jgi:hypothetical protein
MYKRFLLLLIIWAGACQPAREAEPVWTGTPAIPPEATETASGPYVYQTPTPGYPEGGFGPANMPVDINPLTGISTDPGLLDRRPMIIKVSNLPRNVRPQFGLSRADLVYEYYTEEGTTRFAAIYYSRDAEQVGSIRSARFFDEHLINMYGGLFVFGSGDERILDRLYDSDFSDRLIVEWEADCPALCRPDPLTNFLIADTAAVRAYVHAQRISDQRQDLEGMRFQIQAPGTGLSGEQVFVWYSAAIYNRWDYDPASARYFRNADAVNALDGRPEEYELLTDALTGEPVATDNVVILMMPHEFFSVSPEIVEMQFEGTGPAYAFRDGQAYELVWNRPSRERVVSLSTLDGQPFPFKPGVTWFEVMGINSIIRETDSAWRFEMRFP